MKLYWKLSRPAPTAGFSFPDSLFRFFAALCGRAGFKWAFGAFCCAVLLLNMPVNCLTVSAQDGLIFSSPLPLGAPFITTYIHSVQLTPVIDEYRILQGGIWGWEERVQSHNAGLPFSAPEHGRFLMMSPWMVVQGGRRMEKRIVYRIGTDALGRNTWRLPPFEAVEIYKKFPAKRVFIEASVERLGRALMKHRFRKHIDSNGV